MPRDNSRFGQDPLAQAFVAKATPVAVIGPQPAPAKADVKAEIARLDAQIAELQARKAALLGK